MQPHAFDSHKDSKTLVLYTQWVVASNFFPVDMPHVELPVMKPVNTSALQQHSQLEQRSWAGLFKITRAEDVKDRAVRQPCSVTPSHHFNFHQQSMGNRGDFAILLMLACHLLWSGGSKLAMLISVMGNLFSLEILLMGRKGGKGRRAFVSG